MLSNKSNRGEEFIERQTAGEESQSFNFEELPIRNLVLPRRRLMKRKARYVMHVDEVTVTRKGDCATIQHKHEDVPSIQLTLGSKIAEMSDHDIIERWNQWLRSRAQLAAQYKHVAVEVPLDSPQIKYSAWGDQWVARGSVLRCMIGDDEKGQLVVKIDDRELSLEEFGRLLVTYAGWGMRIEFVPEDEVDRRPAREVREPKPDEE